MTRGGVTACVSAGAPVQDGGHPAAPAAVQFGQRDSSQRSAKAAISALAFDDRRTAVDSLRASLSSIFS